MTILLLRTQMRCAQNYLRHHVDRGTLVRLILLAVLLVAGIVVPAYHEMMDPPSAKVPWNSWPRILLCAVLSVPGGLRPESGSRWAAWAVLPVPRRSLAIYDVIHRLAIPVALALILSLMDVARALLHPVWWPRVLIEIAAFLGAGIAGTAVATLWSRKRHRVIARRKAPGVAAAWTRRVIPGHGTVSELIRLDVLYLARRHRSVLATVAAVTLLAAIAAARATSESQGVLLVILVQAVAALLLTNGLLGLFEKDLAAIDRIKALPISGRDVWRSRWLLAASLCLLPGIAGTLALAIRFGPTATLLIAAAAVLFIVATGATLYANVGLSLFPRLQLIALFLNLAWALPVAAWFLAPPVSVVLLAIAVSYGLKRASDAFDRLEMS